MTTPVHVGGYCSPCKAEYQREYRAANVTKTARYMQAYRKKNATKLRRARREYQRAHPPVRDHKLRAREKLQYAVRIGKVLREPCKVCGTTRRVQGHHHDYAQPLDVVWLCARCHTDEHRPRAS